ncbi:MAG: CvpA family protein [Clostridia bacterium]|nr:CvpA family protein [Clostridia bacterium]
MDFLKIYIIDIVLCLIFILCVGYYYRKGFARSILEFFSFFAAAVVTKVYYGDVARFLIENTSLFEDDVLSEQKIRLISLIALFVGASILIKLIISLIDRFFKLPLIKTANKALGLLIGALCGFLLVTAICLVINFVAMTGYEPLVNAISNSKVMEIDSQIIDVVFPEIKSLI